MILTAVFVWLLALSQGNHTDHEYAMSGLHYCLGYSRQMTVQVFSLKHVLTILLSNNLYLGGFLFCLKEILQMLNML